MPFTALIFIFLTQIAIASPYSKISGRLSFDLETSFLTSSENLDSSGDIVDLPLGGEFTEIKNNLKAEYDYSKYLSLSSDLVLNSTKSNDGTFERNSTNFSDLALGFEYIFYRKKFWIMPSLKLNIPLQTYDTNTDEVLGNDPSYDVEALINISSKWKSLYFHIYGGLTYRTEGLSTFIPYGLESLFRNRQWSFGGGIKGIFSIIDDDDTSDETTRIDFLEQVNAGSFKYFSINPNLTSVYAFSKYHFSRSFHIGFAIDQTLFGENAYYGTTIKALIGTTFGNKAKRTIPKLKSREFKTKEDDVFQYEFQKEEDPDQDAFKKRGPIRYQEESIDDDLDSIEQGIEINLKRKKSR